ncbi:MAG: hypothetical protein R6U89_11490 [Dehalococcoidia bacterium]
MEGFGVNQKVQSLRERIRQGIEFQSCVNDLKEIIDSDRGELAKAEVA